MATGRIAVGTALLGMFASGSHWAGANGADLAHARYGHLAPVQQFDFPVGPPDGTGYYDAQAFGENFHLGEDWNGVGAPYDDRGDPVHAVGDGQVTFAADVGRGWGNIVRVVHHVRQQGRSSYIESLYAHLDEITVSVGDRLPRGAVVGTIGDASGEYIPHLHFEIRRRPDLPLGPGYSPDDSQHLDPTAFIRAHR